MMTLFKQDRLEASAIEWLRFDRQCVLVALERGVALAGGVPDVFGVTKDRYAIEVEIKRSVSDFRAEAKKRITIHRQEGWVNVRQFYFLVPHTIAPKIKPQIPDYAGLLVGLERISGFTHAPTIACEKGAPINKSARRLTLRECVTMAKHQTATLLRILSANDGLLDRVAALQSSLQPNQNHDSANIH